MRFIKLGLISIVVFAIIITGFSMLLPSTVHISRAIDINANADTVFAKVNELHEWKDWYADSSVAEISSPSSGKGASIKLGKVLVKVTAVDSTGIEAIWQSSNNEPLTGGFNIYPDKNSSLTTVQWHFTHHVKWYPWEKFGSIVSDKALGPFMEKSLDNLKNQLEKN